MAELSLTELRKRPGRIETFVNKLATKSKFDVVGGGSVTLTKMLCSVNGKIVEYSPALKPSDITRAIEYLKTGAGKNDKITLRGDMDVVLSKLQKTQEFGGTGGSAASGPKGNRGDMAEAIFAAAITARFMNKNQTITNNHIWALISRIDPTKMQQKMVYDSLNENPKILDKVTFQLGLALPNLEAVTNKDIQASLGDIANSAVKYANSSTITAWSKLLYENNRFNEIEVIADGIGDQTGTKVDVRVKIDGKPTDVNVSLKADDVKQFGQVGGSKFEAQQELWSKLLGLNVSSYEAKYNDKIKAKDAIGALNEVYAGAAKEFNTMVKSNKKGAFAKLSKGINYFGTLHEENVTLVQLTKNEAKVYKFDNLEKLLSDQTLTAKLITTKSYPEVSFQNAAGDVLLTIRIKVENKPNGIYVRNYVEKGNLMTKLASFLA